MKRKISISSSIIVILLMLVFTASAFAATYSTSWSFNTGAGGNGKVNGASNGVYYSLTTGTAYLSLTDDYYCDTGSYTVGLFRPGFLGIAVAIGSNTFNSGSGYYHQGTYSIPENRSDYYFIVTGTGTLKYYAASGSLYQ